jgi:hypothetical protein
MKPGGFQYHSNSFQARFCEKCSKANNKRLSRIINKNYREKVSGKSHFRSLQADRSKIFVGSGSFGMRGDWLWEFKS